MAKEKKDFDNTIKAVVTAMEFGSADSGERVVLVHVEPFTSRVGGFEATVTNLTVNMKEFRELAASMSDEQIITFTVGQDDN